MGHGSTLKKLAVVVSLALFSTGFASAKELHVSVDGADANEGTRAAPFRTIQHAANLAQPGDVITVHAGVYRERIDPPRGGESRDKPIVYQAADGELVQIKGSEVVTGWTRVNSDTWKVTIPDTYFGEFNPYQETIAGDWFNPKGRVHHLGAVYLDGHWLTESASLDEVLKPTGENPLWYTDADADTTTIWAQFPGVDPNQGNVEINVREAVFYPETIGVNFITVRGFVLEQAAPNWAPPTAEQVGLIGTHWSKGWVIENNTIRYSICTGVTLGKYGDDWDNRAQSAEGYVGTINRALANGWSTDKIGHHIVRRNHISHCEQAGIVGSMGPIFCRITDNTIHDIHVRQLFTGAEMAGIKFHGAIDTLISRNHVYRCGRGIWLDWMAQGTRVTRNLLHDNGPSEDLFMEVNHGPFLVDNNILLSKSSILVNSQGGAYTHNLVAGEVRVIHRERRLTPYQKPHSTEVADLAPNPSGDDRYYNNVFLHAGLAAYDEAKLPVFMANNVFLAGSRPCRHEPEPAVLPEVDPHVKLLAEADGLYLELTCDNSWLTKSCQLVTSKLLGRASIPDLPFDQPDGTGYRIDTDYLGEQRDAASPRVGPIESLRPGRSRVRVWEAAPLQLTTDGG